MGKSQGAFAQEISWVRNPRLRHSRSFVRRTRSAAACAYPEMTSKKSGEEAASLAGRRPGLLLLFPCEFAVKRGQTDAQQKRRFFLVAFAMLECPIHMRLFLLAHEGF